LSLQKGDLTALGYLGGWVHHEVRLADKLSLRAEVGLDMMFFGGLFFAEDVSHVIGPVIALEPRWYYSFNRRARKSKRIDNNIGSFVTLRASHHSNLFAISNLNDVEIVPDLSFVPTWGIRRVIGKHLALEAGLGIGYRYFFEKSVGFKENSSEVDANLHLRIGYNF
jgi:hypothetical protein